MSTNYYARKHRAPACAHCGHQEPQIEIHIGQRAGGWTFLLHVEEGDPLVPSDWPGWQALLSKPEWSIFNEYEAELSLSELKDEVERRDWRDGVPCKRRPAPARYGGPGYDMESGEFM